MHVEPFSGRAQCGMLLEDVRCDKSIRVVDPTRRDAYRKPRAEVPGGAERRAHSGNLRLIFPPSPGCSGCARWVRVGPVSGHYGFGQKRCAESETRSAGGQRDRSIG